jgi:hypothetical protein
MLYFAYHGYHNGWQRGLVTLVSLFFAWYVALITTKPLILGMNSLTGLDYSGNTYQLFQLFIYLATVVMVVKLFNDTRTVNTKAKDKRDKLSGISMGILSGYFFSVFLLNLSCEWFTQQLGNGKLVNFYVALGISDYTRTLPQINFINNSSNFYQALTSIQNLILFFLLLVFFHGFIFSFLGGADKVLDPRKK